MGKIGIPLPSVAATVVIAVELLGGLAILAGFKVRWASLLLAIDMTVAIIAARLHGGFFTPYGYEFELTLLGACATLAVVGAGALSRDAWLSERTAHAWRDAKNGDFAAILGVVSKGVSSTAMVSFPGRISPVEARSVAAYVGSWWRSARIGALGSPGTALRMRREVRGALCCASLIMSP